MIEYCYSRRFSQDQSSTQPVPKPNARHCAVLVIIELTYKVENMENILRAVPCRSLSSQQYRSEFVSLTTRTRTNFASFFIYFEVKRKWVLKATLHVLVGKHILFKVNTWPPSGVEDCAVNSSQMVHAASSASLYNKLQIMRLYLSDQKVLPATLGYTQNT